MECELEVFEENKVAWRFFFSLKLVNRISQFIIIVIQSMKNEDKKGVKWLDGIFFPEENKPAKHYLVSWYNSKKCM